MNGMEKLREYADATKWGGECRILHAHHGDFARECSERECDDCRAAYLQAIADEIERDRADSPKALAADGEPLEVGDRVWWTWGGQEYVVEQVRSSEEVYVTLANGEFSGQSANPRDLTHQRPVLDADGVPIKVGDTVWRTSDAREFEVTGIDGAFAIRVRDESMDIGVWTTPCGFTHAKPEPPDKTCEDCAYFAKDPNAGNMGVCFAKTVRYGSNKFAYKFTCRWNPTCEKYEERGGR